MLFLYKPELNKKPYDILNMELLNGIHSGYEKPLALQKLNPATPKSLITLIEQIEQLSTNINNSQAEKNKGANSVESKKIRLDVIQVSNDNETYEIHIAINKTENSSIADMAGYIQFLLEENRIPQYACNMKGTNNKTLKLTLDNKKWTDYVNTYPSQPLEFLVNNKTLSTNQYKKINIGQHKVFIIGEHRDFPKFQSMSKFIAKLSENKQAALFLEGVIRDPLREANYLTTNKLAANSLVFGIENKDLQTYLHLSVCNAIMKSLDSVIPGELADAKYDIILILLAYLNLPIITEQDMDNLKSQYKPGFDIINALEKVVKGTSSISAAYIIQKMEKNIKTTYTNTNAWLELSRWLIQILSRELIGSGISEEVLAKNNSLNTENSIVAFMENSLITVYCNNISSKIKELPATCPVYVIVRQSHMDNLTSALLRRNF